MVFSQSDVTSNPNRRQCNDKQTTKKPAAHFSTFGFAQHTGRPFAKPKEPFFANAPMTVFSKIKLTLQTNFKNRK